NHSLDTVLQAGTASPELSRGLISALGWLTFRQAQPHVAQLLDSPSPALRRVGIAALAIHRQNPLPPLVDAISSADPLLSARAMRAAGELGLESVLPELKKSFSDQDDQRRFWAAWSLALRSDDSHALAILKSIVESSSPHREKALQVAIRRMD